MATPGERREAIAILRAAMLAGADPVDRAAGAAPGAAAIVEGVMENREAIDAFLLRSAGGEPPSADASLLRVAVFELAWEPSPQATPAAIAEEAPDEDRAAIRRLLGRVLRRVRRGALDVLFEIDAAGTLPDDALRDAKVAPGSAALARAVLGSRPDLDEVIRTYAERWDIDRMPIVDRNLLRIGAYEIRAGKAPVGAIVNDCVALAKMLSTPESGRFVNGLLGRIAREGRNR